MKALAFFCLGIALLAMPSGLRAMDPLTELDRLILDAQRKLYQVDAHEKPGRQTPDSRETRSAPAPGSQSQPVPFFGEPPALSSQPVPRQARLGKPAGNVKEYGPAFARFTIEVPRGWTAHALENGVKVEKKDQRSILQIELMPTRGLSARDFVSDIERKTGFTAQRKNGYWLCRGMFQGHMFTIALWFSEKRGSCLTVIAAGPDTKGPKRILASLKKVPAS